MKNFISRNLLLSALFPAFSILIYFAFIGSPVYGTNDDVAMNMMISGVFIVSEPTNLVLFIHPIYAEILKLLYEINIHIPWYGMSFIFLAFCALTVFNFSIIRLCNKFNHKDFIWVLLLLNVFISFPILYHLQFTIISGILSISGISFLLSHIIIREERAKIRITSLTIAIGMCFIGAMIRFDATMMVFVIVFPVVVLLILKKLIILKNTANTGNFVRNAIPIIAPLFILLVGILGIEKSKDFYYNKLEWNNFNTIKNSKIPFDIIDSQAIQFDQNTINSFRKIGWTKSDYDMIRTWQCIDKEHFASDKFTKLRQEINANHTEVSINYYERFRDHAIGTIDILMQIDYLIFIFLIPFILTIFKINFKKFLVLVFNLSLLLFTSLIIYSYLACILNRTLFRTDFLIFAAILFYSFILFVSIEPEAQQRSLLQFKNSSFVYRSLYILTFISSLIIFKTKFNNVSNYVSYVKSESNNFHQKTLTEWLNILPENSIIYNVGASFPYEYYLPLNDISFYSQFEKKSIGFISASGANQSPTQLKQLEKYKLDSNFFKSLSHAPNVYFVNSKYNVEVSNSLKQMLSTFYFEKYGITVSFEELNNVAMLSKFNFTSNSNQDLPNP